MSLKDLKKVRDEVNLMHAHIYQSFLKVDSRVFGHHSFPKGDTTTINRHDFAFSEYSK